MNDPMKFVALLIVCTMLFIGFILGFRYILDTTIQTGVQHGVVQTPEEDKPGFDCQVHGNKVCGPHGPFSVSE